MSKDILSETSMPKTNDTALAAFIAAKTEIDAMLERLAALTVSREGACDVFGGLCSNG